MEELDLGAAVSQYGFPIIAALGMGYFIFFVWRWVTEKVDPIQHESHMTLIALIDRVRMLDNDLIRLKTKLEMLIEQNEKALGYEESTDNSNNSNSTPHISK